MEIERALIIRIFSFIRAYLDSHPTSTGWDVSVFNLYPRDGNKRLLLWEITDHISLKQALIIYNLNIVFHQEKFALPHADFPLEC